MPANPTHLGKRSKKSSILTEPRTHFAHADSVQSRFCDEKSSIENFGYPIRNILALFSSSVNRVFGALLVLSFPNLSLADDITLYDTLYSKNVESISSLILQSKDSKRNKHAEIYSSTLFRLGFLYWLNAHSQLKTHGPLPETEKYIRFVLKVHNGSISSDPLYVREYFNDAAQIPSGVLHEITDDWAFDKAVVKDLDTYNKFVHAYRSWLEAPGK